MKCLSMKQEIHFTKYFGNKHNLVMKLASLCILQKEKILQKLWPGS